MDGEVILMGALATLGASARLCKPLGTAPKVYRVFTAKTGYGLSSPQPAQKIHMYAAIAA